MAIPLGFEEFSLEEVNGNFCLETFHSNRKELVLIAAPADFDVAQLKGETVVLNGSTPLTKLNDQEEETMQWELHSTRTANQQHSNLLLPSKIECKHSMQGPGLGVSVNVVRSMKIPHIKYPKKQKEITRLPKPDYLRIRWKPFGSGKPMESKKFESKRSTSSSISKKLSLYRSDKIKDFSQSDESEEKKKKKKKKKKKHSEERSSGTHHEVGTDEKAEMNSNQRDKHVSPKKKSKESRKVPNMIPDKNEKLDNKSPHKKKKKKTRKHSDSDLNSEDENKLFGVSGNTKKQQEPREEQSRNTSLSSERKKRKRKHSMETNNFDNVLKKDEHLEGENVHKKKKKKKK